MPITGKPSALKYSRQTLFFIGRLARFDFQDFEDWWAKNNLVGSREIQGYLEVRDHGDLLKLSDRIDKGDAHV